MRYPRTAQIIKSARKRTGLSQERAAKKLGCSRLQWIRWEQGLHRPDPEGLAPRLADLLGVDVDILTTADADDDEDPSSMSLRRDPDDLLSALAIALEPFHPRNKVGVKA